LSNGQLKSNRSK